MNVPAKAGIDPIEALTPGQVQDRDWLHLKLLMIFHFAVGGVSIGYGGLELLKVADHALQGIVVMHGSPLLAFLSALVSFGRILGIPGGIISILVGRKLRDRRSYRFCLVWSVCQCFLLFPEGVALGVCLWRVLWRESVQELFRRSEAAQKAVHESGIPAAQEEALSPAQVEYRDTISLKLLTVFHYVLGGIGLGVGLTMLAVVAVIVWRVWGSFHWSARFEFFTGLWWGRFATALLLAQFLAAAVLFLGLMLNLAGGPRAIAVGRRLHDRSDWEFCRRRGRLHWLLLFPHGIALGQCMRHALESETIKARFTS